MGKRPKRIAEKYKARSSTTSSLAMPSFDKQALSALTKKIESDFGKEKISSANSSGLLQDKSLETLSRKPQGSKGNDKRSDTGKKRDAQGNVKYSVKSDPPGLKTTADRHIEAGKNDQETLLQEIVALGGTKEDLQLINGVDSDDDVDDAETSVLDPRFAKELSKFIAGLGIEEAADEGSNRSISEVNEKGVEKELQIMSATMTTNKNFPSNDDKNTRNIAKDSTRLMFEARPDWHAAKLTDLPHADLPGITMPRETISELKKYAQTLLEIDTKLYASKSNSSISSHKFLSTIMSSGTLSDKVSALTLIVQESPVHTIMSFESLLTLAKKRSRGQAVTALGAIKDLLGAGVVLPADRRLRSFESQPGLLGAFQEAPATNWKTGDALPGKITDGHMISWAYEDWLKDTYFDVLKVLEGWCNDEVEFARSRAVTYVYELLREKPEQESNLLRLLVNKLGDPDKKIASRTSYLILQLETTHPLMKPIIVRSIESELLLRPGQSSHAKYYAINTLNQTVLSGREEDVARKLLSIYFDLFVSLLKTPESHKALAGPVVNRKGQIQGGGGQVGRKAREKTKKEDISKQVSTETIEKMISAVLTGVNRAFPFARSDDSTLEKHMDTLFKITHSSNFNTSVQALMLIQQLAVSKHLAEERFYRTLYESLLDPRLVTSSKHAMFLNLLFKALKSDLNVKRVKAFAKRLLQVTTLHQPPFVCGVLYLLRELESTFPGLSSLINDPEESDEIEDEVFLDVLENAAGAVYANDSLPATATHPERNYSAGTELSGYDGRKRDPEYSNAEKSCLWELLPFATHFHPSVSMFATRLLGSTEMPAKPDLASHTLIHFLDRFVYRNAKAAASGLRGDSIMQPLAGAEGQRVFVSNRLMRHQTEPLNSESFWRRKVDDIAVDEVFFHRYFSQLGRGRQPVREKKKVLKETLASEVDDGESEDEIWEALVESKPEVEGHSEDDSDLELLDLDDSDVSSSLEDSDLVDSDDEDSLDSGDSLTGVSQSIRGDGPFSDGQNGGSFDEIKASNVELDPVHRMEKKSKKESRKKLKNLPIFASTEDYAEMLRGEDEDV